jgi:hypothetical protein
MMIKLKFVAFFKDAAVLLNIKCIPGLAAQILCETILDVMNI